MMQTVVNLPDNPSAAAAGARIAAEAKACFHEDMLHVALETRLLQEATEASGGNQSEAARRLGVSRLRLIRTLTRSGLQQG